MVTPSTPRSWQAKSEELGHLLGVGAVEQGGVDGHAEAARPGLADRLDRLVEYALAADGLVMMRPVAVQMHREGQIRGRGEAVEFAAQQQRVGAQVDEALLGDQALDDRFHVVVDQRFAAGDGDDRRAAFLRRVQAVLDAQAPVEDFLRIGDLAASGTGQIALEQRFEHQYQRVAPVAGDLLFDDVAAHFQGLDQGDAQGPPPMVTGPRRARLRAV